MLQDRNTVVQRYNYRDDCSAIKLYETVYDQIIFSYIWLMPCFCLSDQCDESIMPWMLLGLIFGPVNLWTRWQVRKKKRRRRKKKEIVMKKKVGAVALNVPVSQCLVWSHHEKCPVAKKGAQIPPSVLEVIRVLDYSLPHQSSSCTKTLYLADNYHQSGRKCPSDRDLSAVSIRAKQQCKCFTATVAGGPCFKAERIIKSDWHKISTHSQSPNKSKLFFPFSATLTEG